MHPTLTVCTHFSLYINLQLSLLVPNTIYDYFLHCCVSGAMWGWGGRHYNCAFPSPGFKAFLKNYILDHVQQIFDLAVLGSESGACPYHSNRVPFYPGTKCKPFLRFTQQCLQSCSMHSNATPCLVNENTCHPGR